MKLWFFLLALFFSATASAYQTGTYTVNIGGLVSNNADPVLACNDANIAAWIGLHFNTQVSASVLGDGATFSCNSNWLTGNVVPFSNMGGTFSFLASAPAASAPVSAPVLSADTQAIIASLASVNSAVAAVGNQMSGVVAAQSLDVPVQVTPTSALIVIAGVITFILGFSMTKGFK